MAHPATEEELLTVFRLVDKDSSGEISVDELVEALERKGISKTESMKMFEDMDVNQDGKISLDEFKSRVYKIGEKARTIFMWYLAFETYDVNHDGTISKDEFKSVISDQGFEISEDEVIQFFKKADANSDEKVDFKEFVKWKTNKDFPESDE